MSNLIFGELKIAQFCSAIFLKPLQQRISQIFFPFLGPFLPGERLKTSWLEDHPDVVRLLLPCEDQSDDSMTRDDEMC